VRPRIAPMLLAAVAAAALSAPARPASASNPACDGLQKPILYVAGPDSLIRVLESIGAALYGQITVVYKGYPSCLAIDNVVNSNRTTPDPSFPTDHSATY